MQRKEGTRPAFLLSVLWALTWVTFYAVLAQAVFLESMSWEVVLHHVTSVAHSISCVVGVCRQLCHLFSLK